MIQKQLCSALLSVFFALHVQAQTVTGLPSPDRTVRIDSSAAHRARLREINRDIWQPFSEAYAANDAEKYIALHAPNFIRGNGGMWAGVKNLEEYAASVRKNFAQNIAQNQKVGIDFTFFERVAGAETASERGIYRYNSMGKDGVPKFFYGQFHVFHRKINGKWKILVDYDSDENGTINAEKFNAGWPTEVLLAADFKQPLPSKTNPSNTDAEKLIRTAAANFSELLKKGDWKAVADAYTPDAKIFPPGLKITEGRESILPFWVAGGQISHHKTTSSEIKITGSEAYDWGVYEGKSVDSNGKESEWKGKYVIIWREVSPGVWKMYLDIWNRTN
jgi:ketosteroid isomerase-like protein